MSCPFCGYDTSATSDLLCPECGRDPVTYRRRVRPWWYWRVVASPVACFAALLFHGMLGQYGMLNERGWLVYGVLTFWNLACAAWMVWFAPRLTSNRSAITIEMLFWGQPLLVWLPAGFLIGDLSYQ